MRDFFSKKNIFSSIVSITLSVAFVASVAFASTTISTDISTGGTLSVTGASTLTGDVAAAGALTVTGISILNGQFQASSTALFGGAVTIYNAAVGLGGHATTTAAGNISTLGTLSVTGQLQASSTALFGGAVTVYNAAVGLGGNATTSATGNFSTLGNIGMGTTSATTLELSAQGSATTTIAAFSSGALKGSCLQLQGPNGNLYRLYATTTGPAIIELGSCK